jgi:hypothetical protein
MREYIEQWLINSLVRIIDPSYQVVTTIRAPPIKKHTKEASSSK